MGVEALPLLVAGAFAQKSAADDVADERKQALMQGINDESQIQGKANSLTNDYVKDNYSGDTRAANYEKQAADRETALGGLLSKQADGGGGDVSSATTGALSDTYTRAKAGATADSAQRARTLTRLLSRSGASGGLFGQEALNGGDYSSNMMGLGVDSNLAKGRAQARYNSAGNAGSNMALLGGLLSGAGGAIGAGGLNFSGGQAPAPLEIRKV